MIEIDNNKNFEEIDKIADELLSQYDKENVVEYNFKNLALLQRETTRQ